MSQRNVCRGLPTMRVAVHQSVLTNAWLSLLFHCDQEIQQSRAEGTLADQKRQRPQSSDSNAALTFAVRAARHGVFVWFLS
jgi:hypothetical protein